MIYGYIRVSSDKNLLLIISIIRMCRLRYRVAGSGFDWDSYIMQFLQKEYYKQNGNEKESLSTVLVRL